MVSRTRVGCAVVVAILLTLAASVVTRGAVQQSEMHTRLGLGSAATVVIVFADDCQACTDAVPFYKTLAALPLMDGKKGRLTFLTTTAPVPAVRWLKTQGVVPHSVVAYPRVLPIDIPKETPSLTLLDPEGRQTGFWKGAFSPEVQKAILQKLDAIR